MVAVDHIGRDPISKFTYQGLGFSDAAEVFVFISGIACAFAYTSLLHKKGWRHLIYALGARSARIYVYYSLSSVAMIFIVSAAATVWGHNIQISDYVGVMKNTDPIAAMWLALSLISPSDLSDILVFYIVMTLIGVPIFLVGFRRDATLTLVASALVWAFSQKFFGSLLSLGDYWALNPFAWQFLFGIGMFVGVKRKSPLHDWQWSLVPIAWTVVSVALVYKGIMRVSHHLGMDADWLAISPSTLIEMKTNLSALRLIHFLSVALLVTRYLDPTSGLLRRPALAPIINMGTRSLEVYSITVILSLSAHIIVNIYHPHTLDKILIDCVIFAIMLLTMVACGPRTHRPLWRH